MRKQYLWFTAGLGMISVVGCMTWPGSSDQKQPQTAPTVSQTARGVPAEKDLTPVETAEICLTMARKIEASSDKRSDAARAIGCYEKARELNPGYADQVASRLAILYDRVDEPGKALAEYQHVLKRTPRDASVLNNLGYHWYNCGNWAEAEKCFRQALAIDPHHERACINLGLALAMQGDNQGALDTFCRVISEAEAYSNLGFAMMVQGRRNEARSYYHQALKYNPSLPRAQAGLARLDKAEKSMMAVAAPRDESR